MAATAFRRSWSGLRLKRKRSLEKAGESIDKEQKQRDGGKEEYAERRREPGRQRTAAGAPTTPAATPATARKDPAPSAVPFRRLIIYWAKLGLEVVKLEEGMAAAQKIVEGMGGYLQSKTSRSMVLRVPAARFFSAMDKLVKLGEVLRKEIRSEDMSEQYLDLRIRLRNAMVMLKRLRELLKQARNVKEALEVEKEMARISERIERFKGRIRLMEHMAALSTISMHFATPARAPRIDIPPHRRTPFDWVRSLGLNRIYRR